MTTGMMRRRSSVRSLLPLHRYHSRQNLEHELTDATNTSLSRLRKARLMEMCEARELDTEGTKKDLIQFLLEWVSDFRMGYSQANPVDLLIARCHEP